MSIPRLSIRIVGLVCILSACGKSGESSLRDLFVPDNGDPVSGNARRRPANESEILWTILIPEVCTAHLISENYLMTANHCGIQPDLEMRSGAAIVAKQGNDLKVDKVVEKSSELDYVIAKITWTSKFPQNQKYSQNIATQPTDVSVSKNADQGEEIYTVGFPYDVKDTWGATYSQGQAKKIEKPNLYYNIGITSGNSGGPVRRIKDDMLVSLTNDGHIQALTPGWKDHDPNDESHWNYGATMWDIYAQSKVLKRLFPNGKLDPEAERALIAEGGGDDLTEDIPILTYTGFYKESDVDAQPSGGQKSGTHPICQDRRMVVALTGKRSVVTKIRIQTSPDPFGCVMQTPFPIRLVNYTVTKTGTNSCGVDVYEGQSDNHIQFQIKDTLSGIRPNDTAVELPQSKIKFEDRSKATCPNASPAVRLTTETFGSKTVNLFGK